MTGPGRRDDNPFGWGSPEPDAGRRVDPAVGGAARGVSQTPAARPIEPMPGGASMHAPDHSDAGVSPETRDSPARAGRVDDAAPSRPAPHPRDVARSSTTDVEAAANRRRAIDPAERRRRAARRRFVVVAAVTTALLAVAAAALGVFLNPFRPAPPSVEAAPVTIGPAAPGAVSGGQLTAGQCFATFESAWQDEFELIDCTGPHAAELYAVVTAVEFAAEPEYPGEGALRAEAMRACQSPSVIDAAAAASVPDLRIDAAYAMTQAEWDAGVRNYWCFASRESGEPLETVLAVA